MTESLGKVVIVGVLDVAGSTNLYMAKSFMKAGYEVIPVNYRTILTTYGVRTLARVIHRLSLDNPKLMLFSKCNGIESSIIGRCSLQGKTFLWFMDGLRTLSAVPEIVDHMSMADYASCTGLGVANEIHKQTGMIIHHIMEGIDQEIYRPTVFDEDFKAEISFIGTANAERNMYMQALTDSGYNVRAYGNGYGEEIHGNMFNVVCASSSAMLAISAEHDTREYFSDRVLRYGASGSFVLHKYSPNMDRYFENNKDLVYFHDVDSLLEAVDKYLVDEAALARQDIAVNLYNKVLQNHTWDNTVQKILTVAEIK
ncbi:MAG: glycosyltransferase family protein [Candidatus Hodarchaeales archaeon]